MDDSSHLASRLLRTRSRRTCSRLERPLRIQNRSPSGLAATIRSTAVRSQIDFYMASSGPPLDADQPLATVATCLVVRLYLPTRSEMQTQDHKECGGYSHCPIVSSTARSAS